MKEVIAMEKKKDGFLNERAIVIPTDILLKNEDSLISRLLYVTDIGYYPHATGHFRQRTEGCKQHILIYCREGEGWYNIGKGKRNVKKNDFFVIEADIPHAYAASTTNPWSIYWLHFTGEQSNAFTSLFNKTINIDDAPSARFEERIQLFSEILVNLEMGYSIENMEYITLCLWHLLGSFRYIPQFREINKPKPQDIIQKTISFMKSNLNKQLTLEEIANYVNYSPNYLSSIFTQKSGLSLINYFNQLKIQKACQLLDFTNKSIKEIAFELAFNDPYYFSKVFTKHMNFSPKSYRKKKKG